MDKPEVTIYAGEPFRVRVQFEDRDAADYVLRVGRDGVGQVTPLPPPPPPVQTPKPAAGAHDAPKPKEEAPPPAE